jgi:hypothetical protein
MGGNRFVAILTNDITEEWKSRDLNPDLSHLSIDCYAVLPFWCIARTGWWPSLLVCDELELGFV